MRLTQRVSWRCAADARKEAQAVLPLVGRTDGGTETAPSPPRQDLSSTRGAVSPQLPGSARGAWTVRPPLRVWGTHRSRAQPENTRLGSRFSWKPRIQTCQLLQWLKHARSRTKVTNWGAVLRLQEHGPPGVREAQDRDTQQTGEYAEGTARGPEG